MDENKNVIVPLILFFVTIGFCFSNNYDGALCSFFIVFTFILLMVFRHNISHGSKEKSYNILPITAPYNVYYGEEFKFTKETIANCLAKHIPYYSALNAGGKEKFLQRLDKFLRSKTFKIHDKQGFKEMPILVSAAAIQLSFGMDNYLLPQFEFIHIYPEEFIHGHNNFNLLAGNVSGQSINISWKHFLEGFEYPDDGQNVGLHEMAHAYYYQNFICERNTDECFVSGFPQFNMLADKAFQLEQTPGYDLYSDYALRNTQEFWAESIEIFFEKPFNLNNSYPEMYAALKTVLRQDPLNKV